MPKDKLKTIYVCTQCGETSPAGGALPLRGVEHYDRGCGGRTRQGIQRQGRCRAARDRADKPGGTEIKTSARPRKKAASSPASASWIAFWVVASSSAV